MIFRRLRPEELEGWYTHCHEVFPEEEDGYFRRHYELDPWADPSLIFVAMDEDVLAASVRVFQRQVWIGGRAVSVGGIGEVATKVGYRRRGLAGNLLQLAIAAMEARDMPVSILFGNQRLYERTGWRFCPVSIGKVRAADLALLPEGALARPFEAEDLPYLMGLYDLYMGRMDGAVIRDEAYWRSWVLGQWHPPQVLVWEGRPVAYACGSVMSEEGTLRVSELAAAPQAEALLPGLLRVLAGDLEAVTLPAPLVPDLSMERTVLPHTMMARLNLPREDWPDSDALVAAMSRAGICGVDSF